MLVTIVGELATKIYSQKGTSKGPFHSSSKMKVLNNEKRGNSYTVIEYFYILLFGLSLTHFISKYFAKKVEIY
jgi:hypothetical protein